MLVTFEDVFMLIKANHSLTLALFLILRYEADICLNVELSERKISDLN